MISLPMLGSPKQTDSSRFQVTLVDKTDKNLKPLEFPRINRFFDNLDDRNTFMKMFERSVNESGGKLIQNDKLSHPLFESFIVVDEKGNQNYEVTVYK